MSEALTVIGIGAAFAAVHSAMATGRSKEWARAAFGEDAVSVAYRLIYCTIGLLTTVAAAVLIGQVPDVVVFSIPSPWSWVLRALQLVSLLFIAAGFRVVSAGEFLGLSQLRRRLAGEERRGDIEGVSEGALQIRGVYRIVRHPMYAGGIAFFLFSPFWTRTWVLIRFLAVAYFVAGALVEDRRLQARYGEEYRRYMRQVPRLIPRLSLSIRKAPPSETTKHV